MMDSVGEHFDLSHLQEYTVEAGRPDTITREKLAAIRKGGAGRVSINPQSMNDQVLQNIGRRHTAHEVLEAYALAREIGFDVINMDTIAGLEGDTPRKFCPHDRYPDWFRAGKHHRAYPGHQARRRPDRQGRKRRPARDRVQAMLTAANAALSAAGYGPYYLYRQKFTAGGFENVGWCKPDTESLYNIAMMEELQTIVSAGAGGVSKRVDRASAR